jgi:hypothetical protein
LSGRFKSMLKVVKKIIVTVFIGIKANESDPSEMVAKRGLVYFDQSKNYSVNLMRPISVI